MNVVNKKLEEKNKVIVKRKFHLLSKVVSVLKFIDE
jgi:hypothetical protein